VAIDPGFAMAHGRLAWALHLAGYGRRAREAATAGLAVAERRGPEGERQALFLRALWAGLYFKPDEALSASARLVELYPDEPTVLEQRARALLDSALLDEALEQAERVLALDPPSPRLGLLRASLLRSKRRFDEATRALDELDARLAGTGNAEALAAAQLERGRLLWERQAYHEAAAHFESAAELYGSVGREGSAADASLELAKLEVVDLGGADRTGRRIAAVLEVAERLGNLHGRAEGLSAGGAWRIRRGDYDAAVPLLREAIDLARQLDNDELLIQPLANLGNLLVYLGRTREAAPLLEQAADVAERTGRRATRTASLKGLAEIREREGDLDGAIAALTRLTEGQEGPDRVASLTRLSLASMEGDRGDLTRERDLTAAAERDLRALGLERDLAEALLSRTRVLSRLGRTGEAEAALAEARRLAGAAQAAETLARCDHEAVALLLDRGRPAQALAQARRALGGADPVDSPLRLLTCRAAVELGQAQRAEADCRSVADDPDISAPDRVEGRAWRALGLLLAGRGAQARAEAEAARESAATIGLRLPLALAAGVLWSLPAELRPPDAERHREAGRRALGDFVASAPPEDRRALIGLPEVRRAARTLELDVEQELLEADRRQEEVSPP
jgi:tetratricopeptide (TPR) repeat protein